MARIRSPFDRKKKPSAKARPARAHWAYLTFEGSERDLLEEIEPRFSARAVAPGLVIAEGRAKDPSGTWRPLVFARQAMCTSSARISATSEALAAALAKLFKKNAPSAGVQLPWCLEVASAAPRRSEDPRAKLAGAIDRELTAALEPQLSRSAAEAYVDEPSDAEQLAQVWIGSADWALVGITPVRDLLSLDPEPRARAPRPAKLKLEEAIRWLRIGPGKSELCVELGARRSRWFEVLLAHGSKAIAVDEPPSGSSGNPLAIDGAMSRRMAFIAANPFVYAPEETVDWLLLDLPRRPAEIAKLIAKWGRRVWARQFIANIRLPPEKKLSAYHEVEQILEAGGWRGLRARQLFGGCSEVIVTGWLDPKVAITGRKPPFQLRSRANQRANQGSTEPKNRARTSAQWPKKTR